MNRRKMLLASGVTFSTVLAGCASESDDDSGNGNGNGNGDDTEPENSDENEEEETGNGDENGSEDENDDNSEEEVEEPSISITSAALQTNNVEVGESVDVDIDLENPGGADGEIDLEVTANGEIVTEVTEAVSADSEEAITETFSIEDAGTYDIAVNNTNAGEFTVQEPDPESYTFSGTGASVEQGVDLEGGLTVVDAIHTGGSSNFQVSLVNDSEYNDNFVNAIGEYDGASAALIDADEYILDVEADGDWEVEIRQPRAASGDALPQSFSDDGPVVVGPFEFSGSHIATGSHSGESNFQATVYPAEGMFGEIVFNEIGEYNGETTFNFNGVGWVDVLADGNWSIEME
ncbi:hypothetical protein [Natronorubrum halophilum]|uniref:hypothetical protein n=1 Tax=Natronorubrum halophilum TaxID=1702106 RepID=UPI0010C23AF5|nr:hypothetical protein [Natronorubrum halophilum]